MITGVVSDQCTTIQQLNLNVDGTQTQLVEGKGVCKSVKWESGNWLSDDSDDPYRCIDPVKLGPWSTVIWTIRLYRMQPILILL